MNDSAKQDNVNELLKTNALSIIQANDLDETADTLTAKCEVISADRKRLTAVYKGDRMSNGAVSCQCFLYQHSGSEPGKKSWAF